MSDTLSLKQFLPYRCNSLAEQISISLSRIYVDKFGISVAGWRILVTLAEYGELQAKEVARLTNMDKVRVSRAVATMSDNKLLERRVCDSDSRVTILCLNSAGKALYQRIAPEALAWEAELLIPLSKSEQRSLAQILDKLEGRLEQMSEAAPS
jgi:DNA-binding MarR family transcriptional regulator|tara:strand:- start:28 stop:486 length:459 start_codon:yes stop_codon:yes gene_type:complete